MRIWTSDNTYPKPRIKIQYSSLLAYPAATMSCHVSNPRNVCADPDVLKFRWQVAIGGALGYELHLPNASDAIKETVKKQIEEYQVYEDLILRGDYYPLCNPYEKEISAYYYADADHARQGPIDAAELVRLRLQGRLLGDVCLLLGGGDGDKMSA